jgi:general secretion pathway protein G
MIVVITVILILLSMAVPIYSRSLIRAREVTLKKNLETLNKVIDQYTRDKKKGPQSLDDLKAAKYIEDIPNDITGRPDTWVPDKDEGDTILYLDQSDPGITGVHSGSDRIALDGTVYSSW